MIVWLNPCSFWICESMTGCLNPCSFWINPWPFWICESMTACLSPCSFWINPCSFWICESVTACLSPCHNVLFAFAVMTSIWMSWPPGFLVGGDAEELCRRHSGERLSTESGVKVMYFFCFFRGTAWRVLLNGGPCPSSFPISSVSRSRRRRRRWRHCG